MRYMGFGFAHDPLRLAVLVGCGAHDDTSPFVGLGQRIVEFAAGWQRIIAQTKDTHPEPGELEFLGADLATERKQQDGCRQGQRSAQHNDRFDRHPVIIDRSMNIAEEMIEDHHLWLVVHPPA